MKMNARAFLIGVEPQRTQKGQEYLVGRFSDELGKSVEVQAWNDQEKQMLNGATQHSLYNIAIDYYKNGKFHSFKLLGMKNATA